MPWAFIKLVKMSLLVNWYLAQFSEWTLAFWSVCSIIQRAWGLATAGWRETLYCRRTPCWGFKAGLQPRSSIYPYQYLLCLLPRAELWRRGSVSVQEFPYGVSRSPVRMQMCEKGKAAFRTVCLLRPYLFVQLWGLNILSIILMPRLK